MLTTCISMLCVAIAVLVFAAWQLLLIRKAQREVLFLHLLRYEQDRSDPVTWTSTAELFDDLQKFMSMGQIHSLLDELESREWVRTEMRWVNTRPRRFVQVVQC
jgi:hypothetical protein